MYNGNFRKEGYSDNYLISRRQADRLCDSVVLGVVSPSRARDEYRRIELEFSHHEPEMTAFFGKIYKSRVERLIKQFPSEKI
jgi:hypothetical protein